MRPSLVIAGLSLVLGAIVTAACADSGDGEEAMPSPDAGASVPAIPDSSTGEEDAPAEAAIEAMCSEAGWCATLLPDADLSVKEIWPLAGHAFAVAESPTLGVKVLEWTEADSKWEYIDDGSQNEAGFGPWVSGLWAPDANEVYYGVAPGFIYRGKRPVAPATKWSWTRHALTDHSHDDFVDPNDAIPRHPVTDERYPALGVWGTSAGDVYAWFTNTIFHWKSVGAAGPAWHPEYIANDPDDSNEHLFFLAARGTGPDDVWFSGARNRVSTRCALVVRKTPAGYERIADGTLSPGGTPCTARADAMLIDGADGWLTEIQPLAPGQFIGIKGRLDLVKISVETSGYSYALAEVPESVAGEQGLRSMSSLPGELWMSGFGRVLRGVEPWGADGGSYEISTTALSRGPLNRTIYQVRGTSSTNLWAIGNRYVLRKTTP